MSAMQQPPAATGTILALLIAALVFPLAACGSGSHPAPAATCINVQRLDALQQRDLRNAANSVPVPPGAKWPTRAADLAGSPQVTAAPWDQSAVNSLYWDRQAENLGTEMQDSPLPAC